MRYKPLFSAEAKPGLAAVHGFPRSLFIDSMASFYTGHVPSGTPTWALIEFETEACLLTARNGIVDVSREDVAELKATNVDYRIRLPSTVWKELLSQVRTSASALGSFKMREGSRAGFGRFMSRFMPPEMKSPALAR
ncbi:MAG: hypothetical protein ACJAZO_003891 [Myxococcota bacterium]